MNLPFSQGRSTHAPLSISGFTGWKWTTSCYCACAVYVSKRRMWRKRWQVLVKGERVAAVKHAHATSRAVGTLWNQITASSPMCVCFQSVADEFSPLPRGCQKGRLRKWKNTVVQRWKRMCLQWICSHKLSDISVMLSEYQTTTPFILAYHFLTILWQSGRLSFLLFWGSSWLLWIIILESC